MKNKTQGQPVPLTGDSLFWLTLSMSSPHEKPEAIWKLFPVSVIGAAARRKNKFFRVVIYSLTCHSQMCGSRSLGAGKEGVALAGRAERILQLFIFRTHDALSDLLVAQVSSLPPPCRAETEPWLPGHPAYRQHTLTQK